MIKAGQQRCLLAWFVGRRKLSWVLNNAVSCPQASSEPSTQAWHQSLTEAGHSCCDRSMHRQMENCVLKKPSTGHVDRLLLSKAGQSCPASLHSGVWKFATGPSLAASSWIASLAGKPCCDCFMRSQLACHTSENRVDKLSNTVLHAAVPESNNGAGKVWPASCISRQVSTYVPRRNLSTVGGVATWPEHTLMENTARLTVGEPAISPESAPVGNAAALPCSASLSNRQSMHVSAEYAWPPLSTQPSFISPKTSDYNDIIERVTEILAQRPWGPAVVDELNKLDVYLNTYHVAAILKVQSDTSVALGFFSWLKEKEGYQHNAFTYSKLFEILGNAKEMHSIKRLMQDMVREKISMIPNVFTTVARTYANAGMLKEAITAFNSMEEYGCTPDSHAYDIIIDILVKAGCREQAYAMYHKMLKCGFFPNLHVCNVLVDSYWRDEKPDDAMALFEKMKEKGEVPNINTYNFLIKGLSKGRKAEALCSVIEEMEDKGLKPNLTTYNTLIGVLVQAGEIDAAVQFLDHMVGSGVKPNNFTYSFLISGLGKVGKLKEAQILFKGLKEMGGAPDDHVYNALVLNFSKAGKLTDAWEALQEMRSAGFKPSRFSYLALVKSLKEADKPDLVRKLFDIMETDDCSPHIVAYHNLLEKYSASKDIDKACQVFQDMKKCSVADVGTYNIMLKIYGRAKDLRKCRQIFTEMCRAGLEPSVVSYSTMIQILGQSGCVKDAYNLFKEMRKKGCKPDAIAYGTILKAMVNAGQVEKAMKVFEEGKKVYKDLLMYSIMIDGFGKARKFDKALGLLKEMRTRGIQPDVVIFNSLIASLLKGDETEEAYDLYRKMPKYGCEPNKRTKDIINSLTKKSTTRRRK